MPLSKKIYGTTKLVNHAVQTAYDASSELGDHDHKK
jgi:hypothetical protein